MRAGKIIFLLGALLTTVSQTGGIAETSSIASRRYFAEKNAVKRTLNVYNWEDYIAPDETDEDENGNEIIIKGLVSKFEDYCLEEYGEDVTVNYSAFDTNETMLAELKTGKGNYDLICPSDYVIQKMITDDLIVPFDEGSTPNYDKYVSPFVLDKISGIIVDGEEGKVSEYARGYMWGTLGILYNDGFSTIKERGITPVEMQKDMEDWLSLWDEKYYNLLAIKDSMRDTYAVGIMKTYDEEFTELYERYNNGELTADEYNKQVSEIFNRSDNQTLDAVEKDLQDLKANAFGFEVDSGKTDMAKGNMFAINVAWSGDAAYAMDNADEFNEEGADRPGFEPTILKFALPKKGANIWFDGWVMPKSVETNHNKDLAQRFVDFLSIPENAAQNMEYIGYTPVIAGNDILQLVQSWYDLRYDEETESINNDYLNGLTQIATDEIIDLPEDEKENYYYTKDISYFFDGTLEGDLTIDNAVFYLTADMKDRQFDTQYPDASVIPSLAVMEDFGPQNASVLLMWEAVKNTALPLWAYILILVVVIILIGFIIGYKIYRYKLVKRRRIRKMKRAEQEKYSNMLFKTLTSQLLSNNS